MSHSARPLPEFQTLPLRLFTPEEPPPAGSPPEPERTDGLSPQMTWQDLFSLWAKENLWARSRPGNLAAVASALSVLDQVAPGLTIAATTEPRARRLERDLRARTWRARPIGPNSQRRILGVWQCLFDSAGPKDRWQNPVAPSGPGLYGWVPDGMGGFARGQPPLLQRPHEEVREPRPMRLTNVAAWLDACLTTPLPATVSPKMLQRMILFVYNTGARRGTLLALTWSMVHGPWAIVPAGAMKGGSREGKFYLNRAARQAMGPAGRPQDLVFGWHRKASWLHCWLRATFQAATVAASDRSDHDGLHRLRKTTNDWIDARNPVAARMQLCHSGGDVNTKHYASRNRLPRLMEKLPQPPGYELPDEGSEARADDRQGRLF